MTIPKEVEKFLDGLVGRSPNTIKSYSSFAKVFFSYVEKSPGDVTIDDVMEFLSWGDQEGWKISTMRHYAKLAQRFLSEFKDDDFIKELKKKLRMLPKSQRYGSLYEGYYIPPDQVECDAEGKVVRVMESTIDRFIRAAPSEEYEVVYTMILRWGLRLSEALNQDLEDIDPKLRKVIVRGKGRGREHKIRNVWVDRDSLRKVLRFAGCSEEEISGAKTFKRKGSIVNLSGRAVEINWKKTGRKIGLSNWKQLTPHDGRHSYAIDFLVKRKNQGMAALVLLKNQLGHSDINTTMIYLDIAGTEAREIFDAGEKPHVEKL